MTKSNVIGKVAIKVIPDTSGFRDDARAKLKRMRLEVEALVTPALDTASARRTKDKLNRTLGEIKSNVKVRVSDKDRIKAQAHIALLARMRAVTLVPTVSKTASAKAAATLAALSGGRVLNSFTRSLGDFIANLDKSIPKLGAVGLGITNVGGFALSAASNLFALSQSLAQIGPSALALPGILGGLTVGLGATVAVLKDFNKVIPEVADRLHSLQDQMSDRFWSRVGEPFRRFIDNIFPKFSKGVRKTSADLGTFFANFAISLNGKLDGSLLAMFDNLNKSIRLAARSTDAYAGVIATLGLTGSEYLPRLSNWFRQIATDFDSWLAKARKDGRLKGWIDEGIFELKEFGRVLRGAGSSLAGLAKAAERAGGSTLTTMADTLARVSKVINGETFQDALTVALMSAHQAMSNITSGSGKQFQKLMLQLSELLSVVLPLAGATLGKKLGGIFDALSRPSVSNGIIAMFDGIDKAIDGLLPALPALADGIGALASVIGRLAASFGPSIGIALAAVGKAVSKVAPAVEELTDALGETLRVGLKALVPALSGLASILKVVAKIVTAVVKGFNALPDGVQQAALLFGVLAVALRGTSVGLTQVKSAAETAYLKTLLLRDGATQAATGMNAAKLGAGVFGTALLGLGSASEQAHPKLSGLLNVAGSAALGFAAGGPWGAALGAGAGLISLLGRNSENAKPKVDLLKGSFEQLKGSLDTATGKATALTNEIIATTLAKSGVATVAGDIGIGLDRVSAAARGNKAAVKEVSDAITAYIQKVSDSGGNVGAAVERVQPLSDVINGLSDRLRKAKDEASVTGQFLGNQDFSAPYRNARSEIEQTVTKQSLFAKALSDFSAGAGNITPKVNTTSLKAAETVAKNLGTSVKELAQLDISPKVLLKADPEQLERIKATVKSARLQAQVRPELIPGSTVALQGKLAAIKAPKVKVDADSKPAIKAVDVFGRAIGPSIEKANSGAKKASTRVAKDAGDAVGKAKGTFATTGSQAGAGFTRGILAWIQPAVAAAAAMAARAAAAARKELKIKSPSRVFMEIGNWTVAGFVKGIEDSQPLATRSIQSTFNAVGMAAIGRGAIDNLVGGMESRYSSVTKSLSGLSKTTDLAIGVKAPSLTRNLRDLSTEISTTGTVIKQFIYNAAEGTKELSSEEQLFAAADRARMVEF